MPANINPIETQTEIRRIDLNAGEKLETNIKTECDTLGAAGYQLCGCFVVASQLVLLFQLTR